jgi:hypothetical protein
VEDFNLWEKELREQYEVPLEAEK